MDKRCERCGGKAKGEYALLDYCAICSRDLCEDCMAKGCCGNVPALSGEKEDQSETIVRRRHAPARK